MIWYHRPIKNGDAGPACFRNRFYTHLMADTDRELIRFASEELSLNPLWVQHPGTPECHFDVVGHPLSLLLHHPGAVQLSLEDYVRRLREKRCQHQERESND